MLQDYCLNFGVDASRYLSSLKLSDSSPQTQNRSKCLADNRSSKNDCSAKWNLRQNSHRRLKAIKRRKSAKKKKKKGNIQERPTKDWAEQPVNQHLGAEL